jgi:DNA-binding transcriptional ArsR family regulator
LPGNRTPNPRAPSVEISETVAKALIHPLRVRLLVELNRRPMSAPQLVAECGGASARDVRRQLRRLEQLGCVEQVGSRRGEGRSGASEHVFRPVQRTRLASSAWDSLSKRDLDAPAGATLTPYLERVGEAIAAGTVDTRADRLLQWQGLVLDQRAWLLTVAEIDALFVRALHLRRQAARRLAASGEEPLRVTIGLGCFESPLPSDLSLTATPDRAGAGAASGRVVSDRLAKALANPLRARILAALNRRPMSATQFATEIGGTTPQNAARHFRRLEGLGCIELVETRRGGRRRGGAEHFFRAVQRSLFDESDWGAVPPSLRSEVTGADFTAYVGRAADAIAAGTIDAREERHLSWMALCFDRPAWEEMVHRSELLLLRSRERAAAAAARLLESRAKPIAATLGVGCFEIPGSAALTPLERLEDFRFDPYRQPAPSER